VIGCDGIVRRDRNRRVADAAPEVDDDVRADLNAPVVRQRDQIGNGGLSAFPADRARAAACRTCPDTLQRVDLVRKEIDLGPAAMTTEASFGHGARLRQHHLVDGVVLLAERGDDGRVPFAILRGGIPLAVAQREVNLFLLRLDDLDDRGGDVLLVVGRRARRPAFVVKMIVRAADSDSASRSSASGRIDVLRRNPLDKYSYSRILS